MATAQTLKPVTDKAPKVKAPPKTVVQRVTDQLKVAALRGRITSDELDAVVAIAGSLKTFLKA